MSIIYFAFIYEEMLKFSMEICLCLVIFFFKNEFSRQNLFFLWPEEYFFIEIKSFLVIICSLHVFPSTKFFFFVSKLVLLNFHLILSQNLSFSHQKFIFLRRNSLFLIENLWFSVENWHFRTKHLFFSIRNLSLSHQKYIFISEITFFPSIRNFFNKKWVLSLIPECFFLAWQTHFGWKIMTFW